MDDIQNLFKETIAEFMENGLDAELDEELGYSKYDYKNKETDNSRNGHSSKTLRTSFGDVEVSVPRDRKGEFETHILKKKQTSISQDISRIVQCLNIQCQRPPLTADAVFRKPLTDHLGGHGMMFVCFLPQQLQKPQEL